MKRINLFAGMLILFVMVAGGVFAQDGGMNGKHDGNPDDKENSKVNLTAEQRAENRSKMMQTELALTDDQYKSVYFLFLNNANKQDALKAAGTDKETMKSEMQKMRDETDAQLKTILTSEQYEKFKGNMKKPGDHDKHKGRMKDHQ